MEPIKIIGLVASIILTMIAYCAFPLIFAELRKKTISKIDYIVICFCVNFVVQVLFYVLANAYDNFLQPPNLSPYIAWTSAFSVIGVKILKNRGMFDEPRTLMTVCKLCDREFPREEKVCPYCAGKVMHSYEIPQINVIGNLIGGFVPFGLGMIIWAVVNVWAGVICMFVGELVFLFSRQRIKSSIKANEPAITKYALKQVLKETEEINRPAMACRVLGIIAGILIVLAVIIGFAM